MSSENKKSSPRVEPPEIFNGFHQRLKEVLDSQKQVWWREKLNVSSSVIGFRWQRGGIPKTDKIVQICELSGVSANWLLMGKGPKYMENPPDPTGEEHRRRANQYIQELEDKIEQYERHISGISKNDDTVESFIRLAKLVNIASLEDIDDIPEEKRFEKFVLPFIIYFRSFSDIIVKVFEIFSDHKSGRKFLLEAFKFAKNEYEKNKYLYKGRNKELDTLFEKQEIFKRLNL